MDFEVTDKLTMWKFTPISTRAIQWANDPACGLESWQWVEGSFYVDHRPAHYLADHLTAEGFVLSQS